SERVRFRRPGRSRGAESTRLRWIGKQAGESIREDRRVPRTDHYTRMALLEHGGYFPNCGGHNWLPRQHCLEQRERYALGEGGQHEDVRRSQHEIGKSTRLNSSHVSISYAVFCLKKKNGRP